MKLGPPRSRRQARVGLDSGGCGFHHATIRRAGCRQHANASCESRGSGASKQLGRVAELTRSHEPRFFEPEYDDGRPVLTDEGRRVVEEETERVQPKME